MFSLLYKRINGVFHFTIVYPDRTYYSGIRKTLEKVFDVAKKKEEEWFRAHNQE